MIFKPHNYQRTCIKFGVERPAAGFFLDPGLGKTMVTYSIFDIRRMKGHTKTLLVVTLLRPAYEVWPREIEKWNLGMSCVVLHGGKKEKLLQKKADVYVINYDGLAWLSNMIAQGKAPWLKGAMLVFDESSKLRNTNTQRFKIVRQLLGMFKYRYILTGTPTPRSLINLFGQIFALDGGERLGRYITHFRAKYCDAFPVYQGGPVVYEIKRGAEEEIYAKIKDVVVRFDDSEIDMPKLVSDYDPKNNKPGTVVELPRAARAVYDDLKRDLITAIENKVIVAKNAGVAVSKLRQVANGGLYIDGQAARQLHDAKTEATLEKLDELEGQPTLISYEFHHDLARLQRALPGTPYIGGGVPMKRVGEIIQEWNKGNLEKLLGQPTSMAHGLNMQGAGRAVIMHSLISDYEAYLQFIRRILRQGSTARRIFVYHIIARNTYDEIQMMNYDRKGMTQEGLFNALKAHLS